MATVTGTASLSITSLSTCNNAIKLVSGTTLLNESRSLIIINNKPLTNHGRTIQIGYNFSFTENSNWNGTKSRYYRRSSSAGKNSWSLSWVMVPGTKRDTADGRYGRDYFKEISLGEDVYTLKLIKTADGTSTTHTVFVESYNENLIRRDLINNVYYWDCSIVFNEA
jgi:hypothetical protein